MNKDLPTTVKWENILSFKKSQPLILRQNIDLKK